MRAKSKQIGYKHIVFHNKANPIIKLNKWHGGRSHNASVPAIDKDIGLVAVNVEGEHMEQQSTHP